MNGLSTVECQKSAIEIRRTVKERLIAEKESIEARLIELVKAIDALEKSPELEHILTTLSSCHY